MAHMYKSVDDKTVIFATNKDKKRGLLNKMTR